MENFQEKRRFPRFNLLVDVATVKRASSSEEKLLLSKNISQAGVCIISLEKFNLGDLMDLKIRLPEGKVEIKAIGKVVWVKELPVKGIHKIQKFEIGLEFVGLNDDVFSQINKYLYNQNT